MNLGFEIRVMIIEVNVAIQAYYFNF